MGASEEGSAAAVSVDKVAGIKRELSVEDLFDPLNRLDVRHPTNASSSSRSRASVVEPQCIMQVKGAHSAAVVLRSSSDHSFDMASIPEEAGWGLEVAHDKDKSPIYGSFNGKSLGSDSGLQMQGTSTSEEDQPVVDDRKQRRMLSNRESARRSRLRKQQHLDELRAHVAQLRAQNSQMLNSFNLASQQFAQITEENRQLRSEAMQLSHQLQQLHHAVTCQRANNGLRHCSHVRQVGQGPQH